MYAIGIDARDFTRELEICPAHRAHALGKNVIPTRRHHISRPSLALAAAVPIAMTPRNIHRRCARHQRLHEDLIPPISLHRGLQRDVVGDSIIVDKRHLTSSDFRQL